MEEFLCVVDSWLVNSILRFHKHWSVVREVERSYASCVWAIKEGFSCHHYHGRRHQCPVEEHVQRDPHTPAPWFIEYLRSDLKKKSATLKMIDVAEILNCFVGQKVTQSLFQILAIDCAISSIRMSSSLCLGRLPPIRWTIDARILSNLTWSSRFSTSGWLSRRPLRTNVFFYTVIHAVNILSKWFKWSSTLHRDGRWWNLSSTGGTIAIWIPNCDYQHLLELEPRLTAGDSLKRVYPVPRSYTSTLGANILITLILARSWPKSTLLLDHSLA